MKREIKFRYWDDDEMIKWDDFFFSDMSAVTDYSGDFSYIEQDKLMQFINVTDINNIEVYEGDKVKGRYMVQRSLNPNAEPEIIHFEGVIKYAEGCFYVKADNGQCVFTFTYPDYELEVIGNIFENPELIK